VIRHESLYIVHTHGHQTDQLYMSWVGKLIHPTVNRYNLWDTILGDFVGQLNHAH